ncbi:MAG: hypothetical protein NTY38_02045, partial [Acidobacteria bacterium]|nr:hypothetical protein [Acidobacteriota bacterium]
FGTVSPLDPQLFTTADECAAALLAGQSTARYTPLEVAGWLENLANQSAASLKRARASSSDPSSPAFRRMEADVLIQRGLGLYFAHKMRAAVYYALSELEAALEELRAARAAWAGLAEQPGSVYVRDISYGSSRHQRGHWLDRLPAIDADIADLQRRLAAAPAAARKVWEIPARPVVACRHTPPPIVRLAIASGAVTTCRLHYRRVNQAERFTYLEMEAAGDAFIATIPSDPASPYPLQYYFELRNSAGLAWLYPGFDANLCNQPYFVTT